MHKAFTALLLMALVVFVSFAFYAGITAVQHESRPTPTPSVSTERPLMITSGGIALRSREIDNMATTVCTLGRDEAYADLREHYQMSDAEIMAFIQKVNAADACDPYNRHRLFDYFPES